MNFISKVGAMTKPTTIQEYIEAAAPAAQPLLEELRKVLREAVPQAEECIKWSEPAFTQGRILFMFSAIKDFVVFAPTPAVVRAFADRLDNIKTTSSTVKFAIGLPLPIDLVRDMAVYRFHDVIEHNARWM